MPAERRIRRTDGRAMIGACPAGIPDRSPDRGEATVSAHWDPCPYVDGGRLPEAEQLLRKLAEGDENSLQSVLAVSPSAQWPPEVLPQRSLSAVTSALVHVAALLAAGGSTTSLRWAVEIALQAGADRDEIVEVLATLAATLGSARVVAAAPRLALAIGYDIEVEGWDGY